MASQLNPEEAMIRAFIQKSRQERCLYLLSDRKRRKTFTDELSHFKWLDDRYAKPITSGQAHTVAQIAALLRSKGAGETVWVVSQKSAMDAKELKLDAALKAVWGTEWGTFLSCVPGKLAYFSEEEGTYLLERQS